MRKKLLSPRDRYLLSVKRDKRKILFIQLSVLVAFVVLWELLTYLEVVDAFFISSPSRIVKTFISMIGNDLTEHISITLLECIIGFAVSTAVGFLVAVLLWWSSTLRRVSEPYLVVLNALPKIALGPIIIIWAGANMNAIIVMTFLICIIVTIMSLQSAFVSVDKGKLFLMQSMGANKFQIFLKLVLPSSVPAFLSVLKINVGLSWVGTIMGEYLVSGAGLGYLIIYGGQVFKLDLVMTSTVILCVLAALMYLAVALCERFFRRYATAQ